MTKLLLSLFLFSALAFARDVPELKARVTDTAGLLSPAGVERLEWALAGHEKRTTNQVAVLTIESLEGEPIEAYSMKVVQKWKLGQKGKDNGVLLLVAKSDRKMRIEVGYGLEGTLTDVLANRILRHEMTPRFRKGDFEGGIETAVTKIVSRLEGTEPPETAITKARAFCASGPQEDLEGRLLFGAFSLPILGLFWIIGVLLGQWALGVFLIPFFLVFPFVIIGPCGSIVVVLLHLICFPIATILFRRTSFAKNHFVRILVRSSGVRSSSSSSGFSSSSRSSSSSSSGFSGGGGSFGGGGSSGSW